ncbi:hypothetical protein OFY17_09625 [Marinomonas sp. C2222]|uniref:Uncharacterized protein n=1 Tax=Marinomonas sargassi TaxID=2984494 RepID=A0ABT2YTE7_9GAMM|nr:hypothetical protein [Marinomonas sargassi]MCV2403135.1 hypothetical protein [Marinomonas sargassi]
MNVQSYKEEKAIDSYVEAVNTCCQSTLDKVNQNRLIMVLQKIHHNWKTRQALHSLSSSQMDDTGITREDIKAELSKPLWK